MCERLQYHQAFFAGRHRPRVGVRVVFLVGVVVFRVAVAVFRVAVVVATVFRIVGTSY